MQESERIARALGRFEAAHREDPRVVTVAGAQVPYAVHYHQRVAAWLARFAPAASQALRLAAGAQHIRRWTIPRERYEEGRSGYKRWRSELARFHAEQAAVILHEEGFDEATIARVGVLVSKRGFVPRGGDLEAQALEDAVCLTFLENELADFTEKHDDDAKLVSIVQKTWAKMSDAGRGAALEVASALPERPLAILRSALGV